MKHAFLQNDAPANTPLDAVETAIARARKHRRRGDDRRALVLLREAALADEWRARTWTILGAFLIERGNHAEAARALRHAAWLRTRAGEDKRAAVCERLMLSAKAA